MEFYDWKRHDLEIGPHASEYVSALAAIYPVSNFQSSFSPFLAVLRVIGTKTLPQSRDLLPRYTYLGHSVLLFLSIKGNN